MIRAVIEVDGKDQWDFEQNLKAALGKLGFEPKREPDYFTRDLCYAVTDSGLDPQGLVKTYREKHGVGIASH